MRSVALDLGATTISYSEVRDGKVIERATGRSLSAFRVLLGPNAAPAKVAFEACREGWRVHDWLKKHGHTPLMIDTTRARQIGVGQHRRKNDRIDADTLALAVDRGSLPLAHVLSEPRRELRYQLSVRRMLVEARAHHVALARETVRARGSRVPTCSVEDFLAKLRATALDESTRLLLKPIDAVLEVLNAQIDVVDEKLQQLCQAEPVVSLLMTAPGAGPIVAAAFVSVIDEAGRFRNAHQVEAYLGLVPSEDSTGGRRRLGSITKHGNSYLRSMLVQAAWCILRLSDTSDPLKLLGEAIAARRGKRVAVIAVARRLAGVLWAMWRRDAVYDPAKLAAASGRGLNGQARATRSRASALERASKKYRTLRGASTARQSKNGNQRGASTAR